MKIGTIQHSTSSSASPPPTNGTTTGRLEMRSGLKVDLARIDRAAPQYERDTGVLGRVRQFFGLRYRLRREQATSLENLSIDPHVAQVTQKYVQYDGLGRVIDVRKAIPQKEFKLLLDAVIQPLPASATKRSLDAKITPAEALTDLYVAVSNDDQIGEKEYLLKLLKEIYLDGAVKISTFRMAVRLLETRSPGPSPQLLAEIKFIGARMLRAYSVTRHNDNYYGRIFDSEFATHIINSDYACVREQVSAISEELLADFESQSRACKEAICKAVARYLRSDYAPWLDTIDEAKKFLAAPSPTRLRALLTLDPTRRFRTDLILSLAVKLMVSSPGYKALVADSNELYLDVIVKQRKLLRATGNSFEKGQRYGVTLPYQRSPVHSAGELGTGVRPIDRYKRNVRNLTEHDQEAQQSERAIGIGMSGSSNLLNALFRKIGADNPRFSITSARLIAAAHLTFSGGHSINEAFTVFNYANAGNVIPLSYSDLAAYFTASPVEELFNSAVGHAFSAVIGASDYVNRQEGANSSPRPSHLV